MSILNTLTSLKISSEPFYPKKIKKDEVKNQIKISDKNNNEKDVINTSQINTDSANDKLKDTISKIQHISKGEIKEYIPKKFKIVSKEK